jgi:hypothetical protein
MFKKNNKNTILSGIQCSNVILYFKLRNFVVSQFGIRNTGRSFKKKNKNAFKCIFYK